MRRANESCLSFLRQNHAWGYNCTMSIVTIQDAQANFPAILARVAAGESLVLVDQDKPVAELKPVAQPARKPRTFGLSKGLYTVPDNFNDPLPDDILDAFEGKNSSLEP